VDAVPTPRLPIGSVLVEQGLIDELDLRRALSEQSRTGQRLGEILVGWGLISWLALAEALAAQWWPERPASGPAPPPAAVPAPELPPAPEPDPMPEPPPAAAEAVDDVSLAELETEVRLAHAEIDRLRDELAARGTGSPRASTPTEGPFLLFALADGAYTVIEREGPFPAVGSSVGVGGTDLPYTVVKVGRSPLPGDARPCAYLQHPG
jgi:hypothetical protein